MRHQVNRCLNRRTRSRGFALGYMLVGLAIASVSLMVLSRMGSGVADARRMVEAQEEVVSQANLIRAKLIACTVNFPGGDNGLGYRAQLPVTPGSGLVADILCPGNPNANKSIWSPADGIYAPRTLTGFSSWSYVHDATSARIFISATAGSNPNAAALNNAALKFGTQASVVSGVLTITIAN